MEECPNQIVLDVHNSRLGRAQEDLELPSSYLERAKDDPIYGAGIQRLVVEFSESVAEQSPCPCTECDGVVVDLATGKLYCGRQVPDEVTASNQRILDN